MATIFRAPGEKLTELNVRCSRTFLVNVLPRLITKVAALPLGADTAFVITHPELDFSSINSGETLQRARGILAAAL